MQRILVFSDIDKKTEVNRKAIQTRIAFYKHRQEEERRKQLEERQRRLEERQRRENETAKERILQERKARAEHEARILAEENSKKIKTMDNKNKALLDEAKKLMRI